MAKTYTELLQGAQKIKENELPESNTHDLVGEQLVQMVNRASEDKAALDKILTEHQEQFDNLQNDIDGNTEAINDEKNRAEAAEKANADAIAAEAKNRADAIAAEQTRAEEAEDVLRTIVMQNVGDIRGMKPNLEAAVAGMLDNTEAINDEKNRAEAAEKANADAIAAERDRAVAAEQVNAQGIATNNQIIVTQGKSISALIAQTGSLKLTVTPNVVLRNEQTDVTVKAMFGSTLEPDATADIKILKDAEVVAREDGIKELSLSESLVAGADVAYSAETAYSEKTLTAAQTLSVVDPVFVGTSASNVAATACTDVAVDAYKQTARKSAAGTYNVTVPNKGDYVWLLVPRGFASIKKATLSGFDFPLEAAVVVNIGDSSVLSGGTGIAYSCYRSSNQYAAGELTIVIS